MIITELTIIMNFALKESISVAVKFYSNILIYSFITFTSNDYFKV